MELDYEGLESELLRILDVNKTWVLASSDGCRVSARSMSIIHEGLEIYFQTSRQSDKYSQITKNQNIALCCSNVSIEGVARDVGTWEHNPEIKEIYIRHHKAAYDLYGALPEQVVIEIVPHYAVLWKYLDGKPARDFLYISENKAERLFYFDQPREE